jgi:hypothetical protein
MNILSAMSVLSPQLSVAFVLIDKLVNLDREIGTHIAAGSARGAFFPIDKLGQKRPRRRELFL